MKPLFAIPILLLAAMAGVAQNRTSSINGTVTDASGGTVAGARILAHHVATGILRRTRSEDGGRFRIPRLEVGGYELTAEMEGFKTSRHEGLILEIDRELVVDAVFNNHVASATGYSLMLADTYHRYIRPSAVIEEQDSGRGAAYLPAYRWFLLYFCLAPL